MERTNDQIRDSIDTNERRAKWGGRLIIIGLVGEIILAFVFPGSKSFIENWGPVFATALIAAGVYAEIHFSGRAGRDHQDLQNKTDAKLAEALDRASRTEHELINLKTARRKIFDGKASALSDSLTPFGDILFDIGMGPNDGEVEDFIWDIEPALWGAGWKQIDWMYPGGFVGQITRGGVGSSRPALGSTAASNVLVQLHPEPSTGLVDAADALVGALNKLAIEAHIVDFNIHNTNTDAMHILIGPKR